MTEQLSFGEALRDAGMSRVMLFTPDEWKRRAYEAIQELARAGEPFTSEEVRARIGDPPKAKAMGPIFHAAAMWGWIRKVGERKAERPGMHATTLPIWIGAKVKVVETLSPVGTGGGRMKRALGKLFSALATLAGAAGLIGLAALLGLAFIAAAQGVGR